MHLLKARVQDLQGRMEEQKAPPSMVTSLSQQVSHGMPTFYYVRQIKSLLLKLLLGFWLVIV